MAASFSSARALRALVAVTCLFPVLQACGGRSDTEDYLFDEDGTISVGATSSSAGRGATSTGGTRSGVGGTLGVGASGAVAGASVGGAAPIGGSGIGQAGQPGVAGTIAIGGGVGTGGVSGVAGSGVAGSGIAGAPARQTITCGDGTCDASSQVCCFSGGFQCIPSGQTCSGAVLGCTTHADCSDTGQLCCLSITGDAADASSCKASCDIMGTGRDRQLCQVDGDCQPPFRFCRATVFGLNICTRRP